jgi:hypothetical protein
MYDYDRRTAAASTHPVFDKLFKDSDKIERILTTAANKLTKLADKIDVDSKGYGFSFKPESFALLGKMMEASGPVFDPLRPLLDKGVRELDRIKDEDLQDRDPGDAPLYQYAKYLVDGFRSFNNAFMAVGQAKQDQDGDSVVTTSHELAMAASFLNSLFLQFANQAKRQGHRPDEMPGR